MNSIVLALAFGLGIAGTVASQSGCDECASITGACCKTCRDSKACGDSCIARNQTCHERSGCACNGAGDE